MTEIPQAKIKPHIFVSNCPDICKFQRIGPVTFSRDTFKTVNFRIDT